MRIMLTGANGQVGWELARSLMPLGEVIALTRSQCDLSHPETLPGLVNQIKPEIIINAAAYTAVDKAEEEEELATIINGTSVGVLAEEAKKHNALFVHYSTDYVFDGSKDTPYIEEDTANPINAYGRSKLAGESAIQQIGHDYLIIRTAWVYATRGKNFLNTIIRLAQERNELSIVADQIGNPTWARYIAEATAHCVRSCILDQEKQQLKSQIYHLTSNGDVSWYDFAKFIVTYLVNRNNEDKSTCKIYPIKTSDYKTLAKRPNNSCLSTHKIEKAFGLITPNWMQAVKLCLDDIQ